jgi:hypothetical protein
MAIFQIMMRNSGGSLGNSMNSVSCGWVGGRLGGKLGRLLGCLLGGCSYVWKPDRRSIVSLIGLRGRGFDEMKQRVLPW